MSPEMEYEEVKTIATPFFSLKNSQPVIVRIEEKFKEGRPNPAKPEQAPGKVALCTIMENKGGMGAGVGDKFTVGFPAIAHNTIMESYKEHSYVGRLFKLTKQDKTGGGKANPVSVAEVKVSKK